MAAATTSPQKAAEASAGTAADETDLHIDPPKFTFDTSNKDLELWSFRIPVSLSLSSLKGVKIDKNGSATFSDKSGKEYVIKMDPSGSETESFRVLLPQSRGLIEEDEEDDKSSSSSSDSGNSDDANMDINGDGSKKNDLKTMIPCPVAFSHHFSVLDKVPTLSETQLAPLVGPEPEETLRHSYSHVPQRTGLKRRWMPLGVPPAETDEKRVLKTKAAPKTVKKERSNAIGIPFKLEQPRDESETPAAPSQKRIKLEETPASAADSDDSASADESDEDKNLSKTERKAKRSEKKAAKKAKKEAKKVKKAAKKVKKEKRKSKE